MMVRITYPALSAFLLAAGLAALPARAQNQPAPGTPGAPSPSSPGANSAQSTAALPLATDPGYRLSIGDEISIDVHGEPDMSAAQRIDKQGNVRVPYANEVSLSGKTVREAESYLEKTFVTKKLLKQPLVTINVRQYSSREVTIIGAVNSPGIFHLPKEADTIEIVELVTSIGGFRPTAKANDVRVTRIGDNGKETIFSVDVEAMIYNRRNALKSFLIYPADRILVMERLF
ncbi:polysaccharide biosynthesis/export family protein [Termitidicoccus mucosus]|uniref:Polysaccharide export protein N-terminal domain-containing protein n=1 Tax=Termitidicoccus mucosus TaxID=1184151 RepID=A0A178IC96_9BACT|nr:hypothetical protein AW736_22110 [Opitutaceae bacterium TSB47]